MKELEQQNASILNESGQSVPAYFDLGQDDTASRHSGNCAPVALVCVQCVNLPPVVHHTIAGHSREEIDAVSGQPFGTPDPQHLYGTKCVLLHCVFLQYTASCVLFDLSTEMITVVLPLALSCWCRLLLTPRDLCIVCDYRSR